MLIGLRTLKDVYHGQNPPFAVGQAVESRLGVQWDIWNDSTGGALGILNDGTFTVTSDGQGGSVVTTTTWPGTDSISAAQAGMAVYKQIHCNESVANPTSTYQWADVVKNTTFTANGLPCTMKQMCQAIAAAYIAQHQVTPFRFYGAFHHEPENDGASNGFSQGNPIINGTGTYTGATGATVSGSQIITSFPFNLTTSGGHSGYPSSGSLSLLLTSANGGTYARFTYDSWSGNTLHLTSSLDGLSNLNPVANSAVYQGWTQDLGPTTGDTGQAAAAGALWSAAFNQWMQWWHDAGFYPGAPNQPLVARVATIEGSTVSGDPSRWGGVAAWTGGLNTSLFDIFCIDEYDQAGSSPLKANGQQTAPSSGAWTLNTTGSSSGYPAVGTAEVDDSGGNQQLLSWTALGAGTMTVKAGSYTPGQVIKNNTTITKLYASAGESTTVFDQGLAWANTYGKLFAIGEHGVAPTNGVGTGAGSKTDYFQNHLLPWLQANASRVEFLCLQGNVPPVHPYADWDDQNQTACTAAFTAILTSQIGFMTATGSDQAKVTLSTTDSAAVTSTASDTAAVTTSTIDT